jgi:hypothetical protein
MEEYLQKHFYTKLTIAMISKKGVIIDTTYPIPCKTITKITFNDMNRN